MHIIRCHGKSLGRNSFLHGQPTSSYLCSGEKVSAGDGTAFLCFGARRYIRLCLAQKYLHWEGEIALNKRTLVANIPILTAS